MPHMQVPAWRALLITCCVVLLSTSVASAQFTYRTIVPTLPQVPVITESLVTGLTDKGTMVGQYRAPSGAWGTWLYRSDKKTYTKVIQSGWRLMANDVDGNFRIVGRAIHLQSGEEHSFFKKATTSTFRIIRSAAGEETGSCSNTGAGYAACTYFDEALQKYRGLLWDTSYYVPITPIIDLEVPDVANWVPYGINALYDLVGIVTRYVPDTPPINQLTQGFIRTQEMDEAPVVTLISAPCGGDTAVQDVNEEGLMAVTCDEPTTGQRLSYAYDGVTWEPLMVPGSRETVARRVNNRGQFAGHYVNANNVHQGFLATPIP